jgi:2-hydroxychromene-2-carboxylate isomerase
MTAEQVAEVILKAIAAKEFEVFLPPERGEVVRTVGVDPKALRAMVERNEILGAERLAKRRAATSSPRA